MANTRDLQVALKIKAMTEGTERIDGVTKSVNGLAHAVAGLLTAGAISGFVRTSIAEFTKVEQAYRGLESVANHSGVGIGRAMQEAAKLAADGQMTLQESSKSLQNLLARGYNIDQAVQTINRLKDSAAYGRAAHLSLGEAVTTATEGLKNENSILVDNAGVTKNVSVMWKEYAASIGKTVAELDHADKVQAENNGILRETEAQLGNSAQAAAGYQGEVNRLDAQTQIFMATLGQEFVPILAKTAQAGNFLMENFMTPLFRALRVIGHAVVAVGRDLYTVFDAVINLKFDGLGDRIDENGRKFKKTMDDILLAPFEPKFTPNADSGARRSALPTTAAPASAAAARKAESEARRIAAANLALRLEMAQQAARLEQDDIARQIAANEQAFAAKTIDARDYYIALSEFQRQQAGSEIRALETQRAAEQAAGGGYLDKLRSLANISRINTDIELVERRVSQQQIDNAVARVKANVDTVNSVQALIDSIEQEAFTLALSNDERARAIALLELEKLAAGLTAEEYTKLRDALNGALDSRQAAEARKVALEDAKKQAEDIRTALTDNLQRSISDVLLNGFTGDGARGAVLGFVDMIRTSLANVLSAKITGSILDSFSGDTLTGVGSFLGMGGKKDGSTPGSAIYVSDVAAGGALGAVTGEGGGMFAGFFESIKGFLSSIASGISGLFSGLSNSLAGLLTGGSGGSDTGGWVSAIASAFGYAEGGYTGAGGKYQPAGVVHAGEFVFSADSVRRLGLGALNNLHRLAKGSMAPTMPRLSYADGGLVNLPGSAAPSVTSNTKIVNLFDIESAMSEYLNTRGGERSILNVIQRNPGAVGA